MADIVRCPKCGALNTGVGVRSCSTCGTALYQPTARLRVEERYRHDPIFKRLVDSLEQAINSLMLTPTEVREAAIFACSNVESRRPVELNLTAIRCSGRCGREADVVLSNGTSWCEPCYRQLHVASLKKESIRE